ncbi:hypothetical protein [Terribacillus sp. 7520-G]|nr:hypothetical protein [Terribacillus sp. 7520-G]
MKKLVLSFLFIGTIILSGLAGFSDQNQNENAVKEGDLGSAVFSLNILN